MRSSDPHLNESLSEYTDRMLGAPGSKRRSVGGSASYSYYEVIWRTFQKRFSQLSPAAKRLAVREGVKELFKP